MPFDYQTYLASREWALLREQVRARSGNKCERCLSAPMQACHHLTYERTGAELLTDLQAICNPCHEFVSAKSDRDPLTHNVRVYLAGPFVDDWRMRLMTKPVDQVALVNYQSGFDFALGALKGGFDVTGPWRLDRIGPRSGQDHGMLYDPKGRFGNHMGDFERARVVQFCAKAIEMSSVVFAWLPPTPSPPGGTLWELGYAAALGKFVIVAQPSWECGSPGDDYWVAATAAQLELYEPTAEAAWDRVLAQWPEIYRRGVGVDSFPVAPDR